MLARENFLKEKKLKLKRESLQKIENEIEKKIREKNIKKGNENNNENDNNENDNNNNNENDKNKDKDNQQSKSKRRSSVNYKIGARRSSFFNPKNLKPTTFNKNSNQKKEMLDSSSSKNQNPIVNVSEEMEIGIRRKSEIYDLCINSPFSVRRFSKIHKRESITSATINQNNENLEDDELRLNSQNNTANLPLIRKSKIFLFLFKFFYYLFVFVDGKKYLSIKNRDSYLKKLNNFAEEKEKKME